MSEPMRVMWLLNHTTLRKFELQQLKAYGITEIFLPKFFPYDEGNLSANIDYSEDAYLTIPPEDLAVLNAQDWYESPSAEAWEIANRYFKIAFIAFFPEQVKAAAKYFKGAIILRVFGLSAGYSYSNLFDQHLGSVAVQQLKKIKHRFWFGAGYNHLKDMEGDFLKQRNCFLPVGLEGKDTSNAWTGAKKKILFVCPRIGTSPYFKAIYEKFVQDFSGFDYVIGGAQPVPVSDPKVVGFVPRAVHEANMQECAVMFYHSQEPNHIHYHPFEAIRAGMPLVFMAGGLLDTMGGVKQPGRCITIKEARQKIQRIMGGDQKLINEIRAQQVSLLEPILPENCVKAWQDGFARVLESVKETQVMEVPALKKRIAVIVPVGYRGGSLRGAKLLAQALWEGSRQKGEEAEIIFAHLDDPAIYTNEEFTDLHPAITRRPYQWKNLNYSEAYRAMYYAGHDQWQTSSAEYLVPDDGMKQFMDCDLWVIISDRLPLPLLPVRPYICMVYDYLQRYEAILPHGADLPFLNAARAAERVLVTTHFTERDALQYAGIKPNKLVRVPMLAPVMQMVSSYAMPQDAGSYFLWTTNAAPHKNHLNAIAALKIYYEKLGGTLECRITGVNTEKLLMSDASHIVPAAKLFKTSELLKKNLSWLGELPEASYQSQLVGAAFLWHAGCIDNGTFSVIEAAYSRVPSLSSDYPAMREIDKQFSLNLQWMDAHDPQHMAAQLKFMEVQAVELRSKLPAGSLLQEQSVENLAAEYWKVVRECL
jgi:glycosyltransferase involved in cell wall biosynthesis